MDFGTDAAVSPVGESVNTIERSAQTSAGKVSTPLIPRDLGDSDRSIVLTHIEWSRGSWRCVVEIPSIQKKYDFPFESYESAAACEARWLLECSCSGSENGEKRNGRERSERTKVLSMAKVCSEEFTRLHNALVFIGSAAAWLYAAPGGAPQHIPAAYSGESLARARNEVKAAMAILAQREGIDFSGWEGF